MGGVIPFEGIDMLRFVPCVLIVAATAFLTLACSILAVRKRTRWPARQARIEGAIARWVFPVPGEWASNYSCC